jgi:hypothetical protein
VSPKSRNDDIFYCRVATNDIISMPQTAEETACWTTATIAALYGHAHRWAASRYLKERVSIKVLRETQVGKENFLSTRN